jgi:2-isopropylmalate synthase
MITDDTLREGLQSPGISFTYLEKIELARLISSAGVERALVSYPSAHISEYNVTRDIIKERLFKETFGLGRTLKEDIDLIYETGSNISLHLPFTDFDLDKICQIIYYAKSKGRVVEIAIVDMVKYDKDKIISIARKLSGCGADILQIPDTTGRAQPRKVYDIISALKKNIESKIEVHCHNDLGLAVANSISAIEAGCDYVDTTMLGIGERNGIADMLTVVDYLNNEGIDNIINIDKLMRAYDYLLELILKKMDYSFFARNIPIYGKNVKSITAGTHSTSPKFPSSYVSLNVYTGSGIIREILKRNGINIDERKVKIVLNKIKDIAVNEGRTIDPLEVIKFYGEVL